ncbi:hypothetical protein QBC45DRAFT_338175 [Copromyces sp. CBS 386.78]|nr:hypothetical protein QBC45DRAFT_338175 [Copromyces sp. CBS 386.78]
MPASKAREGMEASHTRANPATRQAKRKREEVDIDSPAKKPPKISEDDKLARDHLATFRKDIRATGKGDHWYEAHKRLHDHLKGRRAKLEAEKTAQIPQYLHEPAFMDSAVDTGRQIVKRSDLGGSDASRTRQPYVEVLLRRLEAALERHYRQHLEDLKSNPSAASTKSRSSMHSYSWIYLIENRLAQNEIKEDVPPFVKRARTRQVARRSRGGREDWWTRSFWPSEIEQSEQDYDGDACQSKNLEITM